MDIEYTKPMLTNHRTDHNWFIKISNFLLWTTLFALAYCQSPLFTSNQNQYFLHGMAHAGVGFLDRDWLANTADPTSVFSTLVEVTQRVFHWEPIFYVYYALLMGIYLYSLFGIARLLFTIDKTSAHALLFLALFFLVHSAGLRFGLSRLINVNWTYVLEDGVADQRMLGPVFQPSSFGVLLALSVYLFLSKRPFPAIISACLAAIIHPTYLLPAGVLTLAYMGLTYWETRNFNKSVILGIVALILVSPTLYKSFFIFGGTDPVAVENARQILVEFRIPHHALVSQWFDATAVVKLLFIFIALYIVRKSRLFVILLSLFCTAGILTIIQVITKNYALALLFPWRISTLLVPLSVTVLIARLVNSFMDWILKKRQSLYRWIIGASIIMIGITVSVGAIRFILDLNRKTNIPERALFNYVADHKQVNDIYLTPAKMQDFRLATGAPVYIEFKSIPYQEQDVLEWYRRINLVNDFYKDMDCDILESITTNDHITHIISDRSSKFTGCSFLTQEYQDQNFEIYGVDK